MTVSCRVAPLGPATPDAVARRARCQPRARFSPIPSIAAWSRAAFGGALGGALAVVEDLDLLQFLEGLAELGLRLVELALQRLGGLAHVVPAGRRRAGIGRIGEMTDIGDSGARLLDGDLPVEFHRHALEIGHHHLDLGHAPALLIDLEAAQADQRVTRFHQDAHSTQRSRPSREPCPTRAPDRTCARQLRSGSHSCIRSEGAVAPPRRRMPRPCRRSGRAVRNHRRWTLLLPYPAPEKPQDAA